MNIYNGQHLLNIWNPLDPERPLEIQLMMTVGNLLSYVVISLVWLFYFVDLMDLST